jgi:hypothetical protein
VVGHPSGDQVNELNVIQRWVSQAVLHYFCVPDRPPAVESVESESILLVRECPPNVNYRPAVSPRLSWDGATIGLDGDSVDSRDFPEIWTVLNWAYSRARCRHGR